MPFSIFRRKIEKYYSVERTDMLGDKYVSYNIEEARDIAERMVDTNHKNYFVFEVKTTFEGDVKVTRHIPVDYFRYEGVYNDGRIADPTVHA